MADRYDVAARHAEGRAAAEHSQSYVWACHLLGYQHPDLTAHGSQVRDWYGSEDGLDLHALDHDCAELWTAVTAIEEALRIQRAQIAELAANWAGSGAAAAAEFLQCHCDAANGVVAGVRAAAEGCAALRDNLWQLIDSKVATAMAIDDRTLAQRPAWLAAAETVKAGVGDRPVADEIINQEVKPYVDNDIRVDWLTVMRSTLASAAASYDALTDRLSTLPATSFQVPGDLWPRRSVPSSEPVQPIGPAVSVPVAPAAAVSPSGGDTAVPPAAGPLPFIPEDPFSAPLDPVPTPSTAPIGGFEDFAATPPISEAGAPFGDANGIPGGSGDLGDLGGVGGLSSLGSLVGRIADAISGLVGSLADGLAGPSGIDGSPFDDAPDADDLLDHDDADDRPEDNADDRPDEEQAADDRPDDEQADDEQADDEQADDEQPDGGEDVTAGQTAQGGPTPPADGPPSASPGEPPGAAALPPADPLPAPPDPQPRGSTPCEIAADELPQAGQ